MANTKPSLEREKFWRDMMARFDASGMPVSAFCPAEGISRSGFYAWRRILAERDASTPQPEFLPVTIRPASASVGLSLELRDGRVLRFGDALPAERIAAVVHALEAAGVRP
jgi:hypothetical protein